VDGESRYGCREIHRESWRELDGERWMEIGGWREMDGDNLTNLYLLITES
jgi:hypothetical protein